MQCPIARPPVTSPLPSTLEDLAKFVEQQSADAWADANKAKDASPWRLVQLSGIKKLHRAYIEVRELLIAELVRQQSNVTTTENQREELYVMAAKSVDGILDLIMSK